MPRSGMVNETFLTATRPPKRTVMSSASQRVVAVVRTVARHASPPSSSSASDALGFLQHLSRPRLREQALATEQHHEHEDRAEQQVVVRREVDVGAELRR